MRNGALERARQTLHSEALALKSLGKILDHNFDQAVSLLQERGGRIVVSGVGKSGFIGMKMAATLTSLGHQSVFLHPVEAIHGDLGFVSPGDVVIAISFSGESPEVIKLVKYLRRDFEVKVITLAKSKNSTLGKLSDQVIEVPVKDEGSPHGVAPMASTTTTLVIGDMIASALTSPKTFKKDHFARLHPGGGLALILNKVEKLMTKGSGVPLVKSSASIAQALKVMSKKRLGVTGVADSQERLLGVVTDGDIRRYLVANAFNPKDNVQKIMTKNPKSINKNASLKDALALMETYKITSLFVKSEKGRVEGIIHIHDILEGNLA